MPGNKADTGARNARGQFKKGVSGNPSGRPKKPAELAEHGLKAFGRIVKIAEESDNEKLRFEANRWLAEMAFGKPTQSTEIEGSLDTSPTVIEFKGALDEWSR